jgi:predicted membrane protein
VQQQKQAGECVVSSQILVEQVNKGEGRAGEVLMAVVMKMTVFWHDTMYSGRKWPT